MLIPSSGYSNLPIPSMVNLLLGYSRKNPHLPDGWQTGNPGGRGGREGLEFQVGGGMQARKFVFRGQFRGICKMKVEG